MRRGIGSSHPGRRTSQRVIDAARELLMKEGHARFSMRNVAAHAGLHLANVQYYFPTRDDLVRAILADTGARYRAAYDKLRGGASVDRIERFKAVVEFNLRDVSTLQTRRFFIQLWALLSTLDGDSDQLLNELYRIDIQQLSECIADLVPGTQAAEIRRRATLLAAMIEGLVVVRGAHTGNAAEMKRLMARAHTMGMQIARGA
ncbi:MAG: TetR/AcrR family transcriptional regulator [Steroidobacteraceae bacterium]